jgi:septal ring factor EnvC (AmiA/AmiB activator)
MRRIGFPSRAGAALWVLALALALPVRLSFGAEPARDQQIRDVQQQLRQIRHEREQLRKNLESYADKAKSTLGEIETLSAAVRDSRRRIRELEGLRQEVLAARAARAEQIETLRARAARAENRIRLQLRNAYRLAKIEAAASLVALAEDRRFFKNGAYLALLTRADREALANYQRLTQELTEAQAAAQRTLQEQAAVLDALLAEQAQGVESERALRRALAEIRRNEKLSQAYLQDLEQAMTGMETALARLEAEPPPERSTEDLPAPDQLKGKLPPPALGQVIAAFGRQDPRYELKKFQRGIVIGLAEGAEVRAVAGGKAVHAGPFRGYDELVVLDHGHGLFTVYGHLEQLTVQKGGWVEAGAALGRATFQAVDQGYSLYFEVRLKGAAEDPLLWLEPGVLSLAEAAAGK